MKITIPKLFEALQLGKEAEKLEPLVQFVNGAVEQLVKALQLRLTLRDNAYAEIREVTFKKPAGANDPWTAEFTPAQRTVEGVLSLQTQAADGNTVASWRYDFTTRGSIILSVYPRLMTSSVPLTIKFAILFQ